MIRLSEKRWKRKTRAAVIVAVSERKPPARAFLRNWRQIPGLSPSKKKRGIRSWYGKPQNKARSCAALPPEITKPDISALWAEKQSQIKAGELIEEFIKENDEYVQGLIDELDRNGISISSNATPCPVCNNGFLRKRKGQNGFFWGCSCYPECKTTFPDKDGKPDMEAKSRSEGSMSRLEAPALHVVKKLLSGLKAFSVPGASLKSGLKCQEKTDTKSG
jgi:DNA topoisomerase-3